MKPNRNLLVGLFTGCVIFGLLVAIRGYNGAWEPWNFPVAERPFMDLRVITEGAEAYRQGLDPLQSNPTDIDKRPVNYPRIWHTLYMLGIDREDTVWLGCLSWVLFAAGLLAVMPPLKPVETIAMLAAVFSPAVMLGLERGNTDLLMFFLLAMAVVTRASALSLVLVLLAFCLKLFPLAGLAILLGRDRAAATRLLVIALLLVLLYLLYNLHDLQLISEATPRDTWLSYGWHVLWMKIVPWSPKAAGWVKLGSGLVVAALMLTGLAAAVRRKPAPMIEEDAVLAAFRVGAACYLGTYLLGNNFIYRLIFLLPVLPALFVQARRGSGSTWAARLAAAGIFASLWSLQLDRALAGWRHGPAVSFAFTEAAHWILFGALAWLFGHTLPAWAGKAMRSAWRLQTADAAKRGGSV